MAEQRTITNIVPTYLLQGDELLIIALNHIEVGEFNLARDKWLKHCIPALDKRYASLEDLEDMSISGVSISDDGTMINLFGDSVTYTTGSSLFRYDKFSCILVQLVTYLVFVELSYFVFAELPSSSMRLRTVYDDCSTNNCPTAELYADHPDEFFPDHKFSKG